MAFSGHKDLASSLVATAPSPPLSGTTLTLVSGADMPATPFYATVCPADASPTKTNAEVVLVTGLTSGVATVVRAQGGTSAKSIAAGYRFFNSVTSEWADEIEAALESPPGIFYPETYGAAGDNTTNDIAAVQAAVTAANVAGGDVVLRQPYKILPASSYTSILQPGANVRIVFEGKGALNVSASAPDGSIVIDLGGFNDNAVVDPVIDSADKQDGIAIQLGNGARQLIDGGVIKNTHLHVYMVGVGSDSQVLGTWMVQAGYGILTQDASTPTRIGVHDCVITGGGGRPGDGIALNTPSGGASSWLISGNICGGQTSTAVSNGFGIDCARAHDVTIVDNFIYSVALEGIHIEDGSYDIFARSNTIQGCGRSGFYAVSGGSTTMRNIVVQDNFLTGNGTTAGRPAIQFEAGGAYYFNDVRILGNTVYANGKTGVANCAGIEAGYFTRGLEISGNRVIGQLGNLSGSLGVGISCNGASEASSVIGNTVKGNGVGLALSNAHVSTIVTDNTMSGNTVAPLTNGATGFVNIHHNNGWTTENSGLMIVSDGGTIDHGLDATCTSVRLTPAVAGTVASAGSFGADTFTVALKNWTSGALTAAAPQLVSWDANCYQDQTVAVLDTMTGSAGTLLTAHQGEIGSSVWTRNPFSSDSGSYTVLTDPNRLRINTANVDQVFWPNGAFLSADYIVEADLTCMSNIASEAAILARQQTGQADGLGDTGYLFRFVGTAVPGGTWSLQKRIATVPTQPATTVVTLGTSSQVLTPGQTYHMKLKVVGLALTCYVDGVAVITVTDTAPTITAAGYSGLKLGSNPGTAMTDSTGYHLDNFVCRAI